MPDQPTNGYTVGKFRDNVQTALQKKDVFIPNYECVNCQYATINLQDMVQHQVADDHRWKSPAHVDPPPVADALAQPAAKENI